jgi:glycerophosphoryl diester phosphodiesterase
MKIYAHRGYSAAHPENTLAAVQGAIDLGVYGVELDIHLSSDGVPVVIHDQDLARTTNGTGAVASKTVANLATLDAGNGQGVPTLDDVLTLANGRLHFDIEIKGKNCEQAVLDVLSRHPQTNAAISSFDWDVLANVRALAPDIELWGSWMMSPTKLSTRPCRSEPRHSPSTISPSPRLQWKKPR